MPAEPAPRDHAPDPTAAASASPLSRRTFIHGSAALAAVNLAPGWLMSSAHAQGSDVLKIGLVGCGGRGRGALRNAIDAAAKQGATVQCVATCDYFADKALATGEEHNVPAEQRFSGPTGYQQVMQTDADLVILATPPLFRPTHLEAAVNAGKHVFMEKPVAVDPPGCRKVISLGDLAKEKGLSIVAGTQRRHDSAFQQHAAAVHAGSIGDIVSGNIYWCMGQLWYRTRNPGESDADYLVRNWTSFTEMSGDHIVEQHVHQIDVANWVMGTPPQAAVGMGGRLRRVTGNQFDSFAVEFDYGQGRIINSMCRQINGCWNRVDSQFIGTQGRMWDNRRIARYDKADIALPEVPAGTTDYTDRKVAKRSAYVNEHIALQSSIFTGAGLNEARQVAESTMAAVMGRVAAYTGQQVRWDDVMNDPSSAFYDLQVAVTPQDFENANVVAPADDAAPSPGGEIRPPRKN